jgi:dihydrofolate reductase
MTNIEAIVAVDQNFGLAKNGQIPWKSKTDMTFFKQKTINNVVVMGSKTLLSLPKGAPLKDRLNIILTNKYLNEKKSEKTNDNLLYFNELEMLAFLQKPEKYIQQDQYKYLNKDYTIFIIGGKQIYDLLCNQCSTIWITKIKADYKCDLIFSKDILDSFSVSVIELEDDELEIIKLTN